MLFQVVPTTPRFQVFTVLNQELLTFVERSQETAGFRRELFTAGVVGQACWDNSKERNARARNDLTKEKFENFFIEIQELNVARRTQLFECLRDNQELSIFFRNPRPNLIESFPSALTDSFKILATHLYESTKGLRPIIRYCGGINISAHFRTYQASNGNVCKACGMSLLSTLRANVPRSKQWRADYDHQLCKSKYPLYAVHPDNLIPLCDICNQDAKKSKNLFRDSRGSIRPSFYPYEESCQEFVDVEIEDLRDPEPSLGLRWLTEDDVILNKLDTWDDVYEISNLFEGKYFDLALQIIDDINPQGFEHMKEQIAERARQPNRTTFLRKAWTFWEHKFFSQLNQLQDDDLEALWDKVEFILAQGNEGGQSIEQGA
jgi:hypothetical protein